MINYIAYRLLMLIPVVFGVLLLTFLAKSVIPSDAATSQFEGVLTEEAAKEAIANIRAKYHLDKPWYQQFGIFVVNLAHGDLGESIRTRRPITKEIGFRYWNTLILTFAALAIAVVIGVVTGIVSAYYKDTWLDFTAMTIGVSGLSMPLFFFGILLILIFSVWLNWLPVISRGGFTALILPALALGLIEAASLTRVTRSSMLEVLNQEYIRAARAKGFSETVVILRHALPNALLGVITILGLNFGNLIGGAFIVEVIFGWHGIGELAVFAVNTRDFNIIIATTLVLAVTYILVNLIVDILYTWIDPRIDYGT